MSLPEEQSDYEEWSVYSAADRYAHLTGTRSSDFQPAWDCLLSLIETEDSDGVRQWCEIWKNIPESTQTQIIENRTTPMYEAAATGSVDIIGTLVKYGFHTKYQRKHGNQLERFVPIHNAAQNGHVDVVKKLIEEYSVPVDTRNIFGWTPLMWAVKSNHTHVVKYLITKGADPNNIPFRRIDLSPLVLSVLKCSQENAYLLLDSGADVNMRITNAGSVLNTAVSRGYLDMVKLLCNRGAKLDIINNQGRGIMHLALRPRPNLALIRYLIKLNVSLDVVSEDGYSPLCHGLLSALDCEDVLEWAPVLLDAGHHLSRQDYNTVKELIKFPPDQLEKMDDMVEEYLSVPKTLRQLCCFRIRRLLGIRLYRCIDYLPLPSAVKEYICLKNILPPDLTSTEDNSEHFLRHV